MSGDLAPYLRETEIVDFSNAAIARRAQTLRRDSPVATAAAAYAFVRDEIRHSWDAQDTIVTCTASETLREETGICYSKTHLLAALLRALDIPAGFDYQRLTLFDSAADGMCVHAISTVFLDGRWIRLDARGNKPGVDAQFSLDREQLAFPIRAHEGERDYRFNLADPHPAIVRTLRENVDVRDMYRKRLPTELLLPESPRPVERLIH